MKDAGSIAAALAGVLVGCASADLLGAQGRNMVTVPNRSPTTSILRPRYRGNGREINASAFYPPAIPQKTCLPIPPSVRELQCVLSTDCGKRQNFLGFSLSMRPGNAPLPVRGSDCAAGL